MHVSLLTISGLETDFQCHSRSNIIVLLYFPIYNFLLMLKETNIYNIRFRCYIHLKKSISLMIGPKHWTTHSHSYPHSNFLWLGQNIGPLTPTLTLSVMFLWLGQNIGPLTATLTLTVIFLWLGQNIGPLTPTLPLTVIFYDWAKTLDHSLPLLPSQ